MHSELFVGAAASPVWHTESCARSRLPVYRKDMSRRERRYFVYSLGGVWLARRGREILAKATDQADAWRAAAKHARDNPPSAVYLLSVDGRVQEERHYGDLDDTILG